LYVPRELVEACQRGEPGAFDELVRLTHRTVYSMAYRLMGSADDAADVTQDVYVRVWRGLRTFRGDANAGTWLYRITANTAMTHLKRRGRAGILMDPRDVPEATVSDGSDAHADADALERALVKLSPAQRAAVVLKDVYGWTCEEIAKEMRTTEGAVKVRLFRARQRLADELASAGVVVPLAKRKRTPS